MPSFLLLQESLINLYTNRALRVKLHEKSLVSCDHSSYLLASPASFASAQSSRRSFHYLTRPFPPMLPSRTLCPNELCPLPLGAVGPCRSTTSAALRPLLSPLPNSQLFTPASCLTLARALPPAIHASLTYSLGTDFSASFLSPQDCWTGSGLSNSLSSS